MLNKINTIVEQKNSYIIMGQICIAKGYRGKGVFRGLYQAMKKFIPSTYTKIIAEVDAKNKRSIAAHKAIDFKELKRYSTGDTESVLVVITYLIYHLYRFSGVVNKLEEKSFFDKANGISFKKTGRVIILFVILNLTLNTLYAFIIKSIETFAKLREELVANMVLLMMALFLLIISHLIQNGYQLKKENDLTI